MDGVETPNPQDVDKSHIFFNPSLTRLVIYYKKLFLKGKFLSPSIIYSPMLTYTYIYSLPFLPHIGAIIKSSFKI